MKTKSSSVPESTPRGAQSGQRSRMWNLRTHLKRFWAATVDTYVLKAGEIRPSFCFQTVKIAWFFVRFLFDYPKFSEAVIFHPFSMARIWRHLFWLIAISQFVNFLSILKIEVVKLPFSMPTKWGMSIDFQWRQKSQRQHPPFQATFSVNSRSASLKATHLWPFC